MAGRVIALLLLILGAGHPAIGQTVSAPASVPSTATASSLTSAFMFAPETPRLVPVGSVTAVPPTLTALHVSFGALQVLDMFSTMRGINAGLREASPLMRAVAGRPAAMMAVKLGSGATTILLTRRMARKNRLASIVTMAALNSAYSVIVVRNWRAVRTP